MGLQLRQTRTIALDVLICNQCIIQIFGPFIPLFNQYLSVRVKWIQCILSYELTSFLLKKWKNPVLGAVCPVLSTALKSIFIYFSFVYIVSA